MRMSHGCHHPRAVVTLRKLALLAFAAAASQASRATVPSRSAFASAVTRGCRRSCVGLCHATADVSTASPAVSSARSGGAHGALRRGLVGGVFAAASGPLPALGFARNGLNVEGKPLEARTSQLARRLIDMGNFRTYIGGLTARAQSRSTMSATPGRMEGELVDIVGEETERGGAEMVSKLRFAFDGVLKDMESRQGIAEDIIAEFRALPQALDAQFLVAQTAANQGEILEWKEPVSGSTYTGGRLEFELEKMQTIGERALQLTKKAAKMLPEPTVFQWREKQ